MLNIRSSYALDKDSNVILDTSYFMNGYYFADGIRRQMFSILWSYYRHGSSRYALILLNIFEHHLIYGNPNSYLSTGPNFERDSGFGCSRLSPTDAPLVDCIHTDGYAASMTLQALTAPTNHFGTLVPMGTVDFYPNWGKFAKKFAKFTFGPVFQSD